MDIEWRVVPGYEDYEVSRCGQVRSLLTGVPRVLKQHIKQRSAKRGKSSYKAVSLHPKGWDKNKKMTVHRLVCLAFHDNPENKPHVNHKDGDSLNNHADNLEWCTPQENTIHAWETGLCKRVWNPTKEQIEYIVENYAKLGSAIIAEHVGLPQKIVLVYGKKNGADIKAASFKKIVDTRNGKIYNSINELISEYGDNVKKWRRRLSNERPNKTPFRYIDNRGNITEATVFEAKPRYITPRQVKPIAVFDMDGKELQRFNYISDAAIYVNGNPDAISDFLKGRCEHHKNHKFKLLDADGSYIEPAPFITKRKPKIVKPKGEISPPKSVAKYNLQGELLETYGSVGLAAKSLGADKKQFRRQIGKSPTGYARGYHWKVID